MKNNKKRIVIVIICASLAINLGVLSVLLMNRKVTQSRYHDSWMPEDIEWTVYVGDELPSKESYFNDDYFVIRDSWETYRKQKGKWSYVGTIVDLEDVKTPDIFWVNQLYDLYQKSNKWYHGDSKEWVYDLRDGYLFTKTYYSVRFFDDSANDKKELFSTSIRRRENAQFEGNPPVKPFDSEYFYSFDEWDHSLENVIESFDTYAVYSRHKNGTLVKPNQDGTISIGFDEDDSIKSSIISLEIPETIDGKPVTKIDDAAFSECSHLEYVGLPSTIEYIGEHAFFACESLKRINIPKNVSFISDTAFSSSLLSLESINVDDENTNYTDDDGVLFTSDKKTIMRYPPAKKPQNDIYVMDKNIRYISSFCFADFVDVNEFVLPTKLVQIGTWAFKNTSINRLLIPDNCKILSGNFISGCLSLESINVNDSVYYSSIDGVLYSKDKEELFRVPEGKDINTGFVFDEKVNTLKAYCFSGTNVSNISIPFTVESIDSYCFSYLEYLKEIYVPNNVLNMNSRAFYSCHDLIVNCEIESIIPSWAYDWAHTRDYVQENDTGYVKQINWGVPRG